MIISTEMINNMMLEEILKERGQFKMRMLEAAKTMDTNREKEYQEKLNEFRTKYPYLCKPVQDDR